MKRRIRHGTRYFQDKYGSGSECELTIWQDTANPLYHTILLKELFRSGRDSLNGSGSVVGVIEKLATQIVKQYGILPQFVTFLIQNTLFDYPFESVEMVWSGQEFCDPRFSTVHQPSELATFLPEEFFTTGGNSLDVTSPR